MSRFAFSFAIIISGLLSGFAFTRLQASLQTRRRTRRDTRSGRERFRIGLQKFALFVLNPIAFVGAVWSLRLTDARYAALPIVGLATLVSGYLFGRAGAGFLRLPLRRAGVFIPSSSFTNIGSIGGLIIFVLVGEAGFALLPFYKLFEETWYFSVLFPTAKRYGEKLMAGFPSGEAGSVRKPGHREAASPAGFSGTLRRIATDPFIIISISSVLVGLALNLSGLRRPPFYSGLNSVLIPLASWITLFTIGMRMNIGNLFEHPRTTLLFLGMRMLLPPIALSLGFLLGLGGTEGGTGIKTVLVLSSMPVGFLGVVPPAMYGLDVEFANRLWLLSTMTLVFTLPLLSLLLKMTA